ncbi:MAG: sigma-70 family RNA polymerase sigma factor [Vicinamibacterales bacterium]|nr:sigma-70 family RNA polymerase sigma factor [Vicinamibacterales bacterium]
MDESDPVALEFLQTALVHHRTVLRVSRYLARDRAVAEDLTQETFLKAWQSFQRFQRGTNCRAWLVGILYFVWSHERRRRGRERVVFDSDAADANVVLYDPPTPEQITDDSVLAVFETLPGPLQEVVLLADVEELTYREVAALLEIPLGTVMSRLHRARRVLRHELAGYARERGIRGVSEDDRSGGPPRVKAQP